MVELSYLCLHRFRNYYIQNLSEIFDFYRLNNNTKLELLNKLKDDYFTIRNKNTKYFKTSLT